MGETPSDHGRRRYLMWVPDFDTRASILNMEIQSDWKDEIKNQWINNKKQISEGLLYEFGSQNADLKIENFRAIDSKPFSILAYHNSFFSQIRNSFVIGSYYAALASACALGERILNHLIIDLRDEFQNRSEYKSVARKKSFSNWELVVETLEAWNVLLPDVAAEFRELSVLRNQSIHFNIKTYSTVREDSLRAILHLRKIIERQFGFFGKQPWIIEGTKGQQFLKKSYENAPFIRKYMMPICPFVGPRFSISFEGGSGPKVFDFADYGSPSWSDDEFREQYEIRDPNKLAVLSGASP